MSTLGFIVMAWFISASPSKPAIPFASMEACEVANKKIHMGYDQTCVASGARLPTRYWITGPDIGKEVGKESK